MLKNLVFTLVLIRKFLVTALVGVAMWISPAVAHHSHGNYQLEGLIRLQGTVQEVHWMNPHAWIYLDVTELGTESGLWVLEGGSIAALTRRGWARDDIGAGDAISVRCHQLRDRSKGCLLGFITTEGGEEKEWD